MDRSLGLADLHSPAGDARQPFLGTESSFEMTGSTETESLTKSLGELANVVLNSSVPPSRVHVAARFRPVSDFHKSQVHALQQRSKKVSVPEECVQIQDENIVLSPHTYPTFYSADKVYPPSASTRDVYLGSVSQQVFSFLSGKNACIVNYGHHGTGKTYTSFGLITLAIEHILRVISHGDSVLFTCVEVFRNQIYDLLQLDYHTPVTATVGDTALPSSVHALPLSAISSVSRLLRLIQRRRNMRKLPQSPYSTPGHMIAIFTMQPRGGQSGCQLVVLDVAAASPPTAIADDAKRKEQADTNKSVHALTEVLRHITSESKFIPWRQHLLTEILKECWEEDGYLSIIGSASPSIVAESETKNTLIFLSSMAEARKLRRKSKTRQSTSNAPTHVISPALSQKLQTTLSSLQPSQTQQADSNGFARSELSLLSSSMRQSFHRNEKNVLRPRAHSPMGPTSGSSHNLSAQTLPVSVGGPIPQSGQPISFAQWLVSTVSADPSAAAVLLSEEPLISSQTTPTASTVGNGVAKRTGVLRAAVDQYDVPSPDPAVRVAELRAKHEAIASLRRNYDAQRALNGGDSHHGRSVTGETDISRESSVLGEEELIQELDDSLPSPAAHSNIPTRNPLSRSQSFTGGNAPTIPPPAVRAVNPLDFATSVYQHLSQRR